MALRGRVFRSSSNHALRCSLGDDQPRLARRREAMTHFAQRSAQRWQRERKEQDFKLFNRDEGMFANLNILFSKRARRSDGPGSELLANYEASDSKPK